MKYIWIVCGLFFFSDAYARSVVNVSVLGRSSKGQFIAIEEFGHTFKENQPFSKIRVINVWKSEDAIKPIAIFGEKGGLQDLDEVRQRSFHALKNNLTGLKISFTR